MLSEKEKHGIAELLHCMDRRDLLSLAQTVTSRLIMPETNVEAVQAVILHTDRAIDLLKRRKVKKELLFRYLHEKHVSIEASAAKSAHVIRVLEVWDSRDTVDSIDIVEDCSLDAPPPAPVPSRNASHTSLCSLDLSRDSFPVNPNRMDSTELRRADSAASIMNCDDQSVNFTASSVPLGSQLSASTSHPQCQEMANNFVKWYFDMLNAAVMSSQTEFGPSHFWPDASAKVELLGVNGEPLESLQVEKNATEVCLMLVNVLKRHALHCNPNLCEEGVRGRLDPHGLVLVLACGTLHNQHTVCGVFEQVFGLARDPAADNNWKVKYTEARLADKTVHEQPSLANSTLCAMAYS